MAYNKFIKKDGTVFLDLTADTVTEADVASGKTFHKADGTLAIGTASGGGGSSLPAGVYWEQLGTDRTTRQLPFIFKNELYVRQSVGDNICNILKYTADGFVTVSENLPMRFSTGSPGIEFGSAVHFIDTGDSWTNHYMWDGSTVTQLANFSSFPDCVFVYNNELYISFADGVCNKWDSATDTLIEDPTVKIKKYVQPHEVAIINNEIYFVDGKTLYKNNNGTVETVKTLTNSLSKIFAEDDKNILGIVAESINASGQCSPPKVVRYDISTDTETVVGYGVTSGVYDSHILYGGKLHIFGGNGHLGEHLVMHEIK